MAATTSPADHQTGLRRLAKDPKEQPHLEEIRHKVQINPKAPDHQKNITTKHRARKNRFRRAETAVMTNLPAALAAATKKRLRAKAGHIAAGQLMVNHLVKKEHSRQKADHTPAEQPTMTQGRQRILAENAPAIKNLFHHAAAQQADLIPMINQKEVSAVKEQVTKNLSHRVANHQQVHLMLMINQNVHLVVKEPATKNLLQARQAGLALKEKAPTHHTMPTDHNAQNQTTIK